VLGTSLSMEWFVPRADTSCRILKGSTTLSKCASSSAAWKPEDGGHHSWKSWWWKLQTNSSSQCQSKRKRKRSTAVNAFSFTWNITPEASRGNKLELHSMIPVTTLEGQQLKLSKLLLHFHDLQILTMNSSLQGYISREGERLLPFAPLRKIKAFRMKVPKRVRPFRRLLEAEGTSNPCRSIRWLFFNFFLEFRNIRERTKSQIVIKRLPTTDEERSKAAACGFGWIH